MNYIDIQTLEKLIKVFEIQKQNIQVLGARWVFGVTSFMLKKTIAEYDLSRWSDWIEIVGYSSVVTYPVNGEYRRVEVLRTEDPGEIFLQNLNIEEPCVSDVEVAIYRVREEVLFGEIVRRLNLKGAIKGHTIALVENHLWSLGALQISADVTKEIYIIRGLKQEQDEIFDTLDNLTRGGVALLTSKILPKRLAWPHGIVSQLVVGAVQGDGLKFEYNLPWLNSVSDLEEVKENKSISASSDLTEKPKNIYEVKPAKICDTVFDSSGELIFSYDWETKTLDVKDKASWRLPEGTRQVAIVEHLIKKAKAGIWAVSHRELMLINKPSSGGSHHISVIFSSNENWGDYIKSISRGVWGFDFTTELEVI